MPNSAKVAPHGVTKKSKSLPKNLKQGVFLATFSETVVTGIQKMKHPRQTFPGFEMPNNCFPSSNCVCASFQLSVSSPGF